MRIQLASDLHLEWLARNVPSARLVERVPDVDVLVLAGDIAKGPQALELFADWPVPDIVYIAGNHEFYGREWEATRAEVRSAARGTRVHFLDNEAVVLNGVRFLGATLWTDFELPGLGIDPATAMAAVQEALLDYRHIRTASGPLLAADTLRDHRVARAWLERELQVPHAGPTVVVTHHAPHPLSVHPRYAGDPVNAGFVSDLTPLLEQADLWLHGHVHDSFDYRVGRARVVCNPAGYIRNVGQVRDGAPVQLENAAFDPRLVIELTTP
jgi:predicted phosphodiesterase